jgi:transposase InsO family protein
VLLCRVLEVSKAGFYAWLRRRPSARAQQDADLTAQIREIHQQSRGTYGSPRVHAALRQREVRVGHNRVARLMGEAGLSGTRRPRRRIQTTVVDPGANPAPNLVNRDFTPQAPDRLWVGDITYIPTLEGWLYLADLLDCCSRKVVGWSLADHLRTDLPLAALRMAITARRPSPGRLVHHSDRGSQYTSAEYQNELAAHGITASMSRRGNCFDNAVAESFFATLKAELVHRCLWLTKAEAARAIFEWIEVFYNRQRLHSTLGNRTPEAYEREVRPTTAA